MIDSAIPCKIIITKEEKGFKNKTIIVKKCETLDHSPYGSAILFRNGLEVDAFESNWTKMYKNFIKKHNSGATFNEKSRNYTIMMKTNMPTQNMLQ